MGQGRPGVFYKQIDLSQIVVGSEGTVAAFAGNARWGPVGTLQALNDFDQFIQLFGKPVSPSETPLHYQVLGWFKLGKACYVSRPQGNSKFGGVEALKDNEIASIAAGLANLPTTPSGSNVIGLYSKYPGVHQDGAINIKIFDRDNTVGEFSIQVGTELNTAKTDFDTGHENYEEHRVSVVSTDKDGFGRSLFVDDVLKRDSLLLAGRTKANAGVDEIPINSTSLLAISTNSYVQASNSDITTAYDLFKPLSSATIDLVLQGGFDNSIANRCMEVARTRGDSIAVIGPDIADFTDVETVSGTSGWKSNITTLDEFGAAYGITFEAKDEFNDKTVIVPGAGYVGGVYAFNDRAAAPWFAPAGGRRGKITGADIDKIWSEADQDTLYDRNINFATKTARFGVTVQGQKTLLGSNSALQRVNVQRLILYIKRGVLAFLEDYIYEFNNAFNRTLITNGINAFLREIGEGLTDFRVICNETNNTALVIDSNQLKVNIYIKPARVGEYLFMRSIITASGVDFEELIATQSIAA